MAQTFKIVVERDSQGGYVATLPEVLGCQAQAESLKTLMERLREAMACCLEGNEAPPQELTGAVHNGGSG
jgi:predicted RNase H-like HicB family nuclease